MVDESLLITVAGAIAGVGLGAIIGYAWVIGLRGLMPGIAFHFPMTTASRWRSPPSCWASWHRSCPRAAPLA